MKKTIAILWLLAAAFLAGACNYDESCWAPGEGQGAGVGGGVIGPGAGGGYGAEPDPEPQGEDGARSVPCSSDALYTCTIRYPAGDPQCGKNACDRPFSGTFADVPAATKRCGEYAAGHGGKCNYDCKAEQSKASAWVCEGPVRGCGAQEGDYDKADCEHVTGHGDTEKKANEDAREACENYLAATTGVPWYCARGTGSDLTCSKSN